MQYIPHAVTKINQPILNHFNIYVKIITPAFEVHMTVSHLPVLLQSDGAIIVCVMHVEQNWEDRKEEFSGWSVLKLTFNCQTQRRQDPANGLEEVVIREMFMWMQR